MKTPGGGVSSGPGLKLSQRCDSNVYVVGLDVLDQVPPGLMQRHAGELAQWRIRDELSPTALGIVAVLSLYRGLKAGPDGCGLQVSVEAWCTVLGRSRRQVCQAFDELKAAGWIKRFRRLVKVDWTDELGRRHQRADVHAVTYLTLYGFRRISRRGETRRLVVRDGTERRSLEAAGVVGTLLVALSRKLTVLARRITDALKSRTPFSGWRAVKPFSVAGGKSPRPVETSTGPPPLAGDDALALEEGEPGQLRDRWRAGKLTAERAWPRAWRSADQRRRVELLDKFERRVLVWSALELGELKRRFLT